MLQTTIEKIRVSTFIIPTESPESDGTLEWNKTTLVVVEAHSNGIRGLGYTYSDHSAAILIQNVLAEQVQGKSAFDVQGNWLTMVRSVRNIGRPGIASAAISAVDIALWDLKARLLQLPFSTLLGSVRHSIPIYGSGGFTSYSISKLQEHMRGWVKQGVSKMKMKIGRDPEEDVKRVKAVREAIGEEPKYLSMPMEHLQLKKR